MRYTETRDRHSTHVKARMTAAAFGGMQQVVEPAWLRQLYGGGLALCLHLHPAHGHRVAESVLSCTLLGVESCTVVSLWQAVCGGCCLVELAWHSVRSRHLQLQRVVARLPACSGCIMVVYAL